MHTATAWVRGWLSLAAAVVLAVLAMIAAFAAIGTDTRVITISLIYVLLVVALYSFVGQSGIFSFGHISFMAIGAYTAALLTIPTETKTMLFADMPGALVGVHLATVPAVLVSGAVAGLMALVVGLVLMRLSGLAASLGTFALLIIVHVVAQNLRQVTNGQSGMPAVPMGLSVGETLVWTCLALLLVAAVVALPIGLRLRSARDDEVAAQSIGVRIYRERCVFWTISGALCGVAGALHARYTGSVSPGSFYLDLTFLTVAMLVVGGARSLSGAVVGASLLSFVMELLRRVSSGGSIGGLELPEVPALSPLLLALFMLVVLLARPAGLTGGRELSLSPRRLRRRPRPPHEPPASVLADTASEN
jgi:branched-chain amino acid transport system permease protein